MKLIDKVGNESLGETSERGVRGVFNTIIKSMENIFGSNIFNNERGFHILIIFSRYQKNMQSDSSTIYDIHQQLNNIEVYHIYIYLILQNTMLITSSIQSKINNIS